MYGLKFGNFTFGDNYVVNGLDLTDLPMRTSSQNTTGQDGGIIWKRLYGKRTITIEGYIVGNDEDDYIDAWRDLVNAFSIGTGESQILQITLGNGDIRYINCKTISMPSIKEEEGHIWDGDFQVILEAEYPFYRDSLVTATAYIVSLSGFPVATPIPTPLGGIAVNTVNLNISGEYGSYPSYVINPVVTNPRITNQTTGETFQLEMEINNAVGPVTLSFDGKGKHIGSNDMYNQYFTGTYFRLVSGNNNIVFTGADVEGSSVQITYSNEYISV